MLCLKSHILYICTPSFIFLVRRSIFPFYHVLKHVVQERRAGREHGHFHHGSIKERLMEKSVIESGDSSGYESSAQAGRSLWRKQELEQ